MSIERNKLHKVNLILEDRFKASPGFSGLLRKDLNSLNISKEKKIKISNDKKTSLNNGLRLNTVESKGNLTIKYFGEIQGEIGIGTTKIVNNDERILTANLLRRINPSGNSRTYLHSSKNQSIKEFQFKKNRLFSPSSTLPYVFKFKRDKPKVLSESEYIYPDRYTKKNYNLEDFYTNHNSSIRNFPSGRKYKIRFNSIKKFSSSHSNWKTSKGIF